MDILKNDIVEGIIEKQGNSGEGVLRIENYPVFLEYGLPGEKVRAKVLRANKTHGFGKIISFETESDERTEPECPYFYDCGGCSLQHQNYEGQLEFKRQRVKDCMERIGGMKDPDIRKTLGMEKPVRYRNKAQVQLGLDKDGRAIAGFYARRSHRIINIDSCLIQNEDSDRVTEIVRNWINEYSIPVFNEEGENQKGSVRSVLIRKGFKTQELMVTLTATDRSVRNTDDLIKSLKEMENLKSVILNINPDKTNTLLGKENITLYGQDRISDYIGDVKFSISPNSFFQVNPIQTEVIYDEVSKLADLKGTETVFDLYCGAGTISLYLAGKAGRVFGVEIVPQAIADARVNAEVNGIGNAEFIEGRSEDKIYELLDNGIKPDLIVVDPPRKGCDESLLKAIADSGTERLIYVSCDPATLARDIKALSASGFKPQIIQPVDNFPQTFHIETIVLMSKFAPNK